MYSVYELKNKINDKKYIGITSCSVAERFKEHESRARCGARNSRLYDAMRKYGSDKFVATVVKTSESENEIRIMECEYIEKTDSYNNGYNCNLGGHGFLHFPEEIKRKIAKSNRGKKRSLEIRNQMSKYRKDNPLPENFGTYLTKGKDNPLAKGYKVQFPDGSIHVGKGIRAFCREHNLMHCKFSSTGKTKGFILLERFNDHPEREYTQASGSAHLPTG